MYYGPTSEAAATAAVELGVEPVPATEPVVAVSSVSFLDYPTVLGSLIPLGPKHVSNDSFPFVYRPPTFLAHLK
jgi:hypothetical protein